MNDLRIFHNEDFGQVRGFLDENGNPWFVAKDVCSILGIGYYRDALARLDDDERGSVLVDTLGGKQEMSTVNETGLYSLILRSRKAAAKAFKRWITHEVIPAIRKTGQYKNCQAGQSITVVTPAGEFIDLLAYVRTLRQMANRDFYPPRMRAEFLAEAASLLSGYPPSRFMPPEESFHHLFQ